MATNNKNTVTEVEEQNFFQKNKKGLMIGGGIVAVILLAIGGWFGILKPMNESKDQAAKEALFPSEKYMQQGDFDKALAGDGQGSIGLTAEMDQHSGTASANLAQLYAGIAYYNQGKYTEAVKAFESFDDCGDNVISPAAKGALGNCYACMKQYDKAVATLKEAAAAADNAALSPQYLIQAGEIYELALNQKDKALECYQMVKDQYKASMQVQSGEIDKYIERAK